MSYIENYVCKMSLPNDDHMKGDNDIMSEVELSKAAQAARREYNRRYYREHREKCHEYAAKYRNAHRAELDAAARAYNHAHPERHREYMRRYWEKKAAQANASTDTL